MTKKKDIPHDPLTGEIIEDPVALDPADLPFLRSYGLRPTRLTDSGREIPDPVPLAPPVGYRPQPSMVDIIRQQIRSAQLAQEAEAAGLETFEEADDFDVDDDFDPSSPYEEIFDPAPPRRRFMTAEEQLDPRRPHRKAPPPAPPAKQAAPAAPEGAPAPSPAQAAPPVPASPASGS